MKQLWHMIERYYPWLLLLLGVDCFCAVILWISDIQVFQTLIGLVVLTSILLFSAILFVLNKRENTHMELFRDFLSDPTICNEERLLSAISQKEGESVRFLASVLREYKNESNNMADALRDYEEYVEGWAHEAKTPLSLLTMLLDNRNDEISPSLQAKLDYVRSQLQEDVTQMLYYARLKSSTKDYRFEDVNLNDCLGEVLEDYAPLLEEKQFVIINKLQSETVYTDRRGLQFMLGQIVSNAIKYSSDSPMLTISMIHSEIADVLSVEDNGIGVKKYDLPYIFQKGFTGDSTDSRKKATGMGLYLVKKIADDLNLYLEATSQWGKVLWLCSIRNTNIARTCGNLRIGLFSQTRYIDFTRFRSNGNMLRLCIFPCYISRRCADLKIVNLAVRQFHISGRRCNFNYICRYIIHFNIAGRIIKREFGSNKAVDFHIAGAIFNGNCSFQRIRNIHGYLSFFAQRELA